MTTREVILVQELEAAKKREAALVQELEAAKKREAAFEQELEAAQKREAKLVHQLLSLRSQLETAKQSEMAINKELTGINAQILTLRSNIVALVLAIRQVIHDFMANVKEFQANLHDFDKISATPQSCNLCNPLCNCKHVAELVAWESVPACIEKLREVTLCAKSGLTKATKDWKSAQGRVDDLTQKARSCVLHTILGKKHTYTMEFANPKAIDFRIEPHPLDSQLEMQPNKKLKTMPPKTMPPPGTGQETNQKKPAAAAPTFAGSSSLDGVQRNLDA